MSHALVHEAPGTSGPRADRNDAAAARKRERRGGRRLGAPIVLQVIAMLGIGALVYPAAADWFAALAHTEERAGYVREVDQLTPTERAAALEAARTYNANLPAGALVDPYSAAGDPVAEAADAAAYRAYEDVLRVPAIDDDGTDNAGTNSAGTASSGTRAANTRSAGTDVIGEVVYPRLGIGLPVYHGAGEAALTRGVGHLYGSSLPVGGESTHSVLTSHSGLVHASLFTKLPQARIGDVFEVRVLGETMFYEVDGLETVEPFVTDSLSVAPGEDRVTLFTCTPIGVNSHRFLVHAVRVPPPTGSAPATAAGSAGFPWWALIFAGGAGGTAYLLFAPPRGRAARGRRAGSGPAAPKFDPTGSSADAAQVTHEKRTP
ncbi:class C sortase [Leucobacter albus]|uniref:Class C sortase n=1 Tax=Leucobacter albus TaxID=272210 RepID=A0ABW3TPF1_9MICO